MSTSSALVSACRFCQHYRPDGRRAGSCQKLGVAVNSHWKSCSVAIPAFSPSWEELQQVIIAQELAPVEEIQPVINPLPLQPQRASQLNPSQRLAWEDRFKSI